MTQDFRRQAAYDLDQYGLVPGDEKSCNETIWANNYVGCGVQWYPPNPAKCCNINPLPDRYRLADLNPIIEFMAKDITQQWNPYEHMDNRIAMAQLQWLDVKNGSGNNRNKDASYTHFINRPSDAFCAQQAAAGGKVPGFLKF